MGTDEGGDRLPYAPGLDGIRGLAVAAVLVFHAGPSTWLPGGFLGVSVFFTLSGYLIGSLAISEVERSGGLGLGAFWARRARRLLPALLVVVAASAVLSRVIELSGRTERELLAGLAYVSNWLELWDGRAYGEMFGAASPASHLWSLAVEEQFYVLFPLAVLGLVRLTGPTRFRTALLAGSALVYLGGLAFAIAVSPTTAYYATPARAPEIAAGVLLAAVAHRHRAEAPRWLGPLGLLALGAVAVAAHRVDLSTDWVGNGGLAGFALLSTAVVAAAGRPGWFSRLVSPPPLVGLGKISYGLYLYHWPVVVVLDHPRVDLAPVPLFAARIGVSLALAIVSYVLIEQPIRHRRLGGSLADGPALLRAGTALAAVAVLVVARSCPRRRHRRSRSSPRPSSTRTRHRRRDHRPTVRDRRPPARPSSCCSATPSPTGWSATAPTASIRPGSHSSTARPRGATGPRAPPPAGPTPAWW